jgi:hypothetical protein
MQNNAWRVQKPLPRASAAVVVRGARSPLRSKLSKFHQGAGPVPRIFASSIASQSWRPL